LIGLVRKLLRNLNVLNLLLLAATLAFAVDRLLPLIDSPVAYTPPRVKAAPAKAPETPASPAPGANPLEFTVIAEQNLFHPERIIPPEKKAEPPLPKPEFVLYGTLITSDLGIAYLEDKKAAPVTTAGRGKRQTALKKGESMSGFLLKEIQADRVTMTRGEETLVVSLNDPQNPKMRDGAAEPAKPGAVARPGSAAPTAEPRGSTPAPAPAPAPAAASPANPPAALSGAPTPGLAAGRTGVSGGITTPARPRYRPLPQSSGSSGTAYPAPSPGFGGPYPAPSPVFPGGPGSPYP
jgi:hypothetical protein